MTTKREKQERYFKEMCHFMKMKSELIPEQNGAEFNRTELRLLNEVVAAQYEGKPLISTQIAKHIGVTRSSVAQMVAALEKRNILHRLPAEDNKKIAYIVLAEGAMELYGAQFEHTLECLGNAVDKFGEKRFNQMCGLWKEFLDVLQAQAAVNKNK